MLKICGTTSPLDAEIAAGAGADCIGLIVEHAASPRTVSLEAARRIALGARVPVVALSVNRDLDSLLEIADKLQPRALQLHGDETPELVRQLSARGWTVWKAISGDAAALSEQARVFSDAGAGAILVDARETTPAGTVYGGTGQIVDWTAVRGLVNQGFRVILAGGLTPHNVARALEIARPWGVDVVSGVESRKGVKDPDKVRAFVARARASRVLQSQGHELGRARIAGE